MHVDGISFEGLVSRSALFATWRTRMATIQKTCSSRVQLRTHLGTIFNALADTDNDGFDKAMRDKIDYDQINSRIVVVTECGTIFLKWDKDGYFNTNQPKRQSYLTCEFSEKFITEEKDINDAITARIKRRDSLLARFTDELCG